MLARYNEGLAGLPLQLPTVEPWARSTVWMYAVLLRDEVGFDAVEFGDASRRRGFRPVRSSGASTSSPFTGNAA